MKSKREYDISIDETKSRMVSDFIGNTPFVKLSNNLYAKLESVNPGGSIKDMGGNEILYGKKDFKNPSLVIKSARLLNNERTT